MKQPNKPNEEDCCNSGCNPCIFDVYEKQLKLYNEYLAYGQQTSSLEENEISQLEYTQFQVVKIMELCISHKLLLLKKSKRKLNNGTVRWNPGDHFLFKYTSGDVPCTRAYTPLKLNIQEEYDFAIIVKKYVDGLVSNYLCNVKNGDLTLWRGPYGSYEITPNTFSRIIMIAQGTGIVPLYSIIEKILSNEDDITRIILFYCCQSQEFLLLREELYAFKSFWNFTYKIFLSHVNNAAFKYQEPVEHHKLNFDDISILKPFSSNDQFLVCGSSPFIHEYSVFLRSEISQPNLYTF